MTCNQIISNDLNMNGHAISSQHDQYKKMVGMTVSRKLFIRLLTEVLMFKYATRL